MTFQWPFGLMLAVPFLFACWWARVPLRALRLVRVVILCLLLLALGGLSLHLPSRHGCVVVVADRSLSMPAGSAAQQSEIVELLTRSMGREDQLGVVAFGEHVAVEQTPQHGPFSGFKNEVGREASNLGEALERALSLIPSDRPGKVLVLSDGRATGKEVDAAAARAAGGAVAIDYRLMQRSGTGDLAVDRVDAPSSVAAGEAFLVSAWIESPIAQEVDYELFRGTKVIAGGKLEVASGRTRMMFRDQAGKAGSQSYRLKIRGSTAVAADPVPENNQARFLVGVRGNKPLLCVGKATSTLPGVLAAAGLETERRSPQDLTWSLEELSGYAGVVIEDTSASQIGTSGLEMLSAWVRETGGGLLTTGGRQAYGSGGYFKSALEPILPVSMELRREHRKLSLAIVVALDRSGSMAMSVPGGRTKMELADVATCEVVKQLSGADQFGCLAVDSIAHEVIPLSDLSEKSKIEQKILQIDSQGGGIFVYEALEKAAAMISAATAGTRHIILFSDAADSEEPGEYKDLLAALQSAGITVSVIGLGTEHDSDAALLQDIARLGGGQCMFTEDATELPRLFAQDTFLVARSTFVEDPTAVRIAPGMTLLTPQVWNNFPQLGGYNLCYLRPGANLAALTQDEYQAPVVASWQAGAGRVLCYTGEADGQFTGAVGDWSRSGEFFTSLARWVSAQDQSLGPDMMLTQQLRGNNSLVELHLDAERATVPFAQVPQLTVLRAREGQKPQAERLPLQWDSADRLSTNVSLSGEETVVVSLEIPGTGRVTLPPTRLLYSPEYAVPQGGAGQHTLEQLAKVTGGVERVNLGTIWTDLPPRPRLVSLAPWLALAALPLLLLEILQRRTGLFSFALPQLVRRSQSRSITTPAPVPSGKMKQASPVSPSRPVPAVPEKPATPAATPAANASGANPGDALSQALSRAQQRNRRS